MQTLTPILRAILSRQTLLTLRSLLHSLSSFFPTMSPQPSPPLTPSPPFNPSQPSTPISYPIKTLHDLKSKSYFTSFHFPFNKCSVDLPLDCTTLPDRPRLLVCHDMAGGYNDDRFVQGGTNFNAYGIWHWYLIDVFVYFSHDLVTLPPPSWVNAAHKHGVKVLGTFITEWDEGKVVCEELLSTKEDARMYAERLAELSAALGFDGWLINMEVKLDMEQIPNLKEFLSHLADTMHSLKPGSLVLWYDSVTVKGSLDWQDRLNDANKSFFDLCDGIFINYTWKKDYPKLSANIAGDRKFDVYMGIDIFGRNTYGGGQWSTNVALDVIKEDGVSAAIFAPGWVYETEQPPDFQTAQNRWWDLIEKSWGVMQNYPRETPFYSDFNQGRGHHFSVDGGQFSDADWCNLSCQSFQPFLEFHEGPESEAIQVLVNPWEESYSGGSSITFRGVLGHHPYVTKRLFLAKLPLEETTLHFSYSVKSEGESVVGLSLVLSTSKDETVSVLLASQGNTLLTMNKFASKFDKVIMPHRVTKLEIAEGWILQENVIAMPGCTLLKIQAVCYKLEPEIYAAHMDSKDNAEKKYEYHAVLGHISITTPSQNVNFPPSSSWQVEGQSIKWEASFEQSKSLSMNILWRLKDGYNSIKSQRYLIYVETISEPNGDPAGKLNRPQEYLGMAHVEAFYVSDFLVPSGTSSLKFTIRVCSVDGACQPLDDSPSFQLDVKVKLVRKSGS